MSRSVIVTGKHRAVEDIWSTEATDPTGSVLVDQRPRGVPPWLVVTLGVVLLLFAALLAWGWIATGNRLSDLQSYTSELEQRVGVAVTETVTEPVVPEDLDRSTAPPPVSTVSPSTVTTT